MAQWRRVWPPIQETQAWSLIWEGPTCHGTKPISHNYWAHILEPRSCNYWAHMPQLLKPACPTACAAQQGRHRQWQACTLQLKSSSCLLQLEKSPCSNKDTEQTKIQYLKKKKRHCNTSICNVPNDQQKRAATKAVPDKIRRALRKTIFKFGG